MSMTYKQTRISEPLPLTVVPTCDSVDGGKLENLLVELQTSSRPENRQLKAQVVDPEGKAIGQAIQAYATQGPQESIRYRFAPGITPGSTPLIISTEIDVITIPRGYAIQLSDANVVDPGGDRVTEVQVIGT